MLVYVCALSPPPLSLSSLAHMKAASLLAQLLQACSQEHQECDVPADAMLNSNVCSSVLKQSVLLPVPSNPRVMLDSTCLLFPSPLFLSLTRSCRCCLHQFLLAVPSPVGEEGTATQRQRERASRPGNGTALHKTAKSTTITTPANGQQQQQALPQRHSIVFGTCTDNRALFDEYLQAEGSPFLRARRRFGGERSHRIVSRISRAAKSVRIKGTRSPAASQGWAPSASPPVCVYVCLCVCVCVCASPYSVHVFLCAIGTATNCAFYLAAALPPPHTHTHTFFFFPWQT